MASEKQNFPFTIAHILLDWGAVEMKSYKIFERLARRYVILLLLFPVCLELMRCVQIDNEYE